MKRIALHSQAHLSLLWCVLRMVASFESPYGVEKGVEVLALVEMCFDGMGAVEKGVGGVGTG